MTVSHGDPDFGERGHGISGRFQILDKACARSPVVAKRVEGRRRDRVDGIGPDQFLDVDDVAIVGVFVPVLAQSTRCVWAPWLASACQRGPLKSSW